MKSVLVIGMGRFGHHLAKTMTNLGNDVMVVDKDAKLINTLSASHPDAVIGDCTDENVVKALGVENFDICFVAIGNNFESSLVVTSHLKRFNAKMIIAKANRDVQADLLKKIGANEIVYPEKESAEKLAVRYNAKNIFDFVRLTSTYSIYEISVPKDWLGKTVSQMAVRQRFKFNIVAVKHENDLDVIPGPDYTFVEDDHIIVIGKADDVFKVAAMP
ncbi:MAG: TrkA family potassium uptake protein [Clostridia bacterium]|nr:TrkA family potassium uptake protein [Clostridia bacterium]